MRRILAAAAILATLVLSLGHVQPVHAQTLPAACVVGQQCIQNERTLTVYNLTNGNSTCVLGKGLVKLCPFAGAVNDAQPGDTLDVYPGVYSEGEVRIAKDLNIKCIGAFPSLAGPGDCIRDPAAGWRPGTIATGNSNLHPDGNGLIGKGAFTLGVSGAAPKVVITGIQFQNATSVHAGTTAALLTSDPSFGNETRNFPLGNNGSITSLVSATLGIGSFTLSLQVNGVAVPGCTNLSVTSPGTTTFPCTATTFGTTDQVSETVSNLVGPVTWTGSTTFRVNYNVITQGCTGGSVPAGAPIICGGDASGALSSLGGDVTCNNCGFFHNVNGLFTDPFVWGTGAAICNNCFLQYNGTGSGQTHSWYCSREFNCQLNNSVMLDTFNGNGFKNRGYQSQITNSTVGDSDACGLTTWVGAMATGGAVVPAGGGMSNEINDPDGGGMTSTGNTFCKSGTTSSNAAMADYGAAIGPWPNSFWHESGNTYKNTAKNGQYLWNPTGNSDVSISGLAIQGNAPSFGIEGVGTITSATLNGAPWTGGTHIDWTPLTQAAGGGPVMDLRGTTGPQTVTTVSPSNANAVLGGGGRLTVNLGAAPEIEPGLGGADVTSTSGFLYFIDFPGDAPSNLTAVSPIGFMNADGDTVTATGSSKGFLIISARNVTYNSCPGAGIGCGTLEIKSSDTRVPSGVINFRGANDSAWCINGCNMVLNGTIVGGGDFYRFFASPNRQVAPGEATVISNVTANINNVPVPLIFNSSGCGVDVSTANINDHSDQTCRDFYYLVNVGLNVVQENSTVDFGPSSGVMASGEIDPAVGANLSAAVIVGAGTSSFKPGGGPGIVQIIPASDTGIKGGYNADIMPAHVSGGTTTVVSYGAAAQHTYISPIAGVTMTSCSSATGNVDTLKFSDLSTVILTGSVGCPNINFGPPPGWNTTASLGLPANAAGVTGMTIPVPAVWTDVSANGFSGEVFGKVCAANGQIVFNGKTGAAAGCVTQAGRPQDVTSAIAVAQLIIGTAPSDTVTASVCDQFNVCAAATMNVAAVNPNDVVLTAPASLTLDSGTTVPVPGLSVKDAYVDATAGATSTETLASATGSVTPASTTGSTSAVNTSLAGAQYTAKLTGGTDTIIFAGSNTGGGTANTSIPVTINWSAAWNDVQLGVPGAQTLPVGQSVSFAGSTIADALATQTGVSVSLTVTNTAGAVLLTFNGSPGAAQTALATFSTTAYTAVGTDILSVTVNNPSGNSATKTVAVTVKQPNDIVLSAPASYTFLTNTVSPMPGLSVGDSFVDAISGATSTVGLSGAGAQPISTTGTTAQVNAALAGATFATGPVARTTSVVMQGINSGGGTAQLAIPITVNFGPEWNDIQVTVPPAQTVVAGQSVSMAGSAIVDAAATQAGTQDTLTVSRSGGTLLFKTDTPANLQTALNALSVPEPTAGTDTLSVTVGNPSGSSVTKNVAITINPAEVDFPSAGGTFTYNSTGTLYKATGVDTVTLDLTGQGNTVSSAAAGTINLTDHSGHNTLVAPSGVRGAISVTNDAGSLWNTYQLDLRAMMAGTGWVPGQDPSTVLRVTSGAITHLQSLNNGVWNDQIVFHGTPKGITLTQLLANAILN